mgnify:FL=1|tara:strand:- start:721 stop:1032 length:312 start_codon:yes stop_codon:yes gene_type:complete
MAAVAQQPQHGNKRSRSGRIIRRPGEIYTPELERFEDDYGSDEYDDDDDGSDIDTEDELDSDDDDLLLDDDDTGSLDDFIVNSDEEDSEMEDDFSDTEYSDSE